jgi:hypothetical protein
VLEGKDKDKDAKIKIKIKMRTVTINYKFLRSEYLMPNNPGPQLPICPQCERPVELENARTDEDGKAIHPECYFLRLRARQGTIQPAD